MDDLPQFMESSQIPWPQFATGGGAGQFLQDYLPQKQLKTLWCWASVASSVAQLYGGPSAQNTIAGQVCQGRNMTQPILGVLCSIGHAGSTRTNGCPRYEEVQLRIGSDSAICCRLAKGEFLRDPHYVAIIGWYCGVSGPVILIGDPGHSNGTITHVSLGNLCTNYPPYDSCTDYTCTAQQSVAGVCIA